MTSQQLLSWRRSHNYTQRQAAEALGVKLRAYQYWEKGRAMPAWAVKLVELMPAD